MKSPAEKSVSMVIYMSQAHAIKMRRGIDHSIDEHAGRKNVRTAGDDYTMYYLLKKNEIKNAWIFALAQIRRVSCHNNLHRTYY